MACVAAGETVRAVAAQFSVSVASVVRWSQRWRATGSAQATKQSGRRSSVLSDDRLWLLDRIAQDSDVTLRQLQADLAARGTVVCYGTVWKFVHGEKLSYKKKRSAERAGSS